MKPGTRYGLAVVLGGIGMVCAWFGHPLFFEGVDHSGLLAALWLLLMPVLWIAETACLYVAFAKTSMLSTRRAAWVASGLATVGVVGVVPFLLWYIVFGFLRLLGA
nr:hypothetical protein [Kibdelosporangium sp. MJ126-NF4]CEL22695.1 hypothetical protein [Kibdelosporangium sp. MJ126-NF4]CTQ89835.1 hypothetical protein [Kibdelosporangium sp. MJ126-NF4]